LASAFSRHNRRAALDAASSAGQVVNGVNLNFRQWVELIPMLLLAALPFIALGFTFRDEAANGIAVICLFFFSIGGGLWIPAEVFTPGALIFAADRVPGARWMAFRKAS
jgi:hypothetical protein